jgi:hypothetical protein
MATQHDPRRIGEPASERDASSTLKVWSTVGAALMVTWFLFAWLILDRHVLDAAGESVGTAFALGVIISLVGALRSHR